MKRQRQLDLLGAYFDAAGQDAIFLSALDGEGVSARLQFDAKRMGRERGVLFHRIGVNPILPLVTHRRTFGRSGLREKPFARIALNVNSARNDAARLVINHFTCGRGRREANGRERDGQTSGHDQPHAVRMSVGLHAQVS